MSFHSVPRQLTDSLPHRPSVPLRTSRSAQSHSVQTLEVPLYTSGIPSRQLPLLLRSLPYGTIEHLTIVSIGRQNEDVNRYSGQQIRNRLIHRFTEARAALSTPAGSPKAKNASGPSLGCAKKPRATSAWALGVHNLSVRARRAYLRRTDHTSPAASAGIQASVPSDSSMWSQPGRCSTSSNSMPACSGSLKLGG